MSVSHGAIRAAVDVLRLPGPVQDSQAAAMPALLLHGAVHGRTGGLRATPGKAIIINHPTVRVHCVRAAIWLLPPTSHIADVHSEKLPKHCKDYVKAQAL